MSTSDFSPLPSSAKIGYGVAQLGIMGVEIVIRIHLLLFSTDILGLRPDLAGYAVALGMIWDAVTDPVMGIISDRTRSPWGKRRPYIFVGGLALAIAIIILFTPPLFSTQEGKFCYLLFSYVFLNTCMTIIQVPLYALGGEITTNSHERNQVYGWLMLFSNLGTILGAVLPGLALMQVETGIADVSDKLKAYSISSIYMALVVIFSSQWTFWSTNQRDPSAVPQKFWGPQKFFLALISTLRNKIFFLFFICYITATIGMSINSVIALYYYQYRLEISPSEINIIISVLMVVMCISLIFWISLAKAYGKKWPAFWGVFLLGIMITCTYPFLPARQFIPPLLAAIFAGMMAGSSVLLYSMVPDIVDYDEMKTGEHREGLYFGFLNLGAKIARASSIALAGNLLSWIGFVPNSHQSPETSQGLAWIFGPGVGFFLITGSLIFLAFPLTEEKHRRIQKILDRKKERKKKD